MMVEWRTTQSPLLPLVLLGAAVVASLGAGVFQQVRQRQVLVNAGVQQSAAVAEGDRLRQQLELLLSGAAELANGGDAPARAVIDALAKQGITYNPGPPVAK